MLYYIVRFGEDEGQTLTPHLYRTGQHKNTFVASRSKEGPHQEVRTEVELLRLIEQGWSVRMSAKGHSPSLISPHSIQGWR